MTCIRSTHLMTVGSAQSSEPEPTKELSKINDDRSNKSKTKSVISHLMIASMVYAPKSRKTMDDSFGL